MEEDDHGRLFYALSLADYHPLDKIIVHASGISEIITDKVVIASGQYALDLIMDPDLAVPAKIVLSRAAVDAKFFDLKTGVAGDVTQKFINYKAKLIIVGDFSDLSENFQALIRENNRVGEIMFVKSL